MVWYRYVKLKKKWVRVESGQEQQLEPDMKK